MKLSQLSMKNFRQFKDESIEFSHDTDDNISVIHGPNGSGKTTILNAFRWVLYDRVDFDQRPERLANEGAMAAASPSDVVPVSVTLEFEHEGSHYRATRSADFRKNDPHDFEGTLENPDLEVEYVDEEDTRHTKANPKTALQEILPPDLSRLFFFDGEYINELAGIDNQDEIQESIRNIMGLTILERAIRHLKEVEDQFQEEMQEYGSNELSDLIDRRKSLEASIDDLEQKVEDYKRKRDKLLGEIQDIESKLEDIGDSSKLEKQRKELRKRRASLENDIEEIEDEIRQTISDNGYLTFGMRAIEQTAEELDRLREEEKIPSELSNSFIDRLLNEEKECICGRPLEEGTEHYHSVEMYRSDVSSEKIDQAAFHIISNIQHLSGKRSELFDDLQDLVQTRREKEDEIEDINGEVSDLTASLEGMTTDGKDHESPDQLEKERQKLKKQRENIGPKIGRIEGKIENRKEEYEEVQDEIEEAREDESKAINARRHWKATEEVRANIESVYQELQDRVRDLSSDHIQETFDKIASKENMRAEITEDFRLKIVQDVGDEEIEVNKSRGERQIASLAFIGSLAAIARERYNANGDSPYFSGGIYPIVMDSPFGTLDKSHQRQVSKVIPELADQIIVFVTDSQWSGPVEDELEQIADKQYFLDFDEGNEEGSYPQTRIVMENPAVADGGVES